jgi:hypothetical protein
MDRFFDSIQYILSIRNILYFLAVLTIVPGLFSFIFIVPIATLYYANKLGKGMEGAVAGCILSVAAIGPFISYFTLGGIIHEAVNRGEEDLVKFPRSINRIINFSVISAIIFGLVFLIIYISGV